MDFFPRMFLSFFVVGRVFRLILGSFPKMLATVLRRVVYPDIIFKIFPLAKNLSALVVIVFDDPVP